MDLHFMVTLRLQLRVDGLGADDAARAGFTGVSATLQSHKSRLAPLSAPRVLDLKVGRRAIVAIAYSQHSMVKFI